MTIEDQLNDSLIQRINVGDLLTRSAARSPAKDAVIDGERRVSYRELEALANRVAHGLIALGYRPGDALALMSGNSPEFLAIYFACAKAGVVCVPVNLFWRNRELAYVLGHARVRGIVVAAPLFEQFLTGIEEEQELRDVFVLGDPPAAPALPPRLRLSSFAALHQDMPDDVPRVLVEDRAPVSYLYTSGTTSAPKGVIGTHAAIYLVSLGTALDSRMSGDDRATAMMPMFHTAQLNAVCTTLIAGGGTIVVVHGFNPEELLDIVEREKITVLFALPMMYRVLLAVQRACPRDVSSLRLAVYGMAPMPDHELRAAMEVFGCGFCSVFGQTEMSPTGTCFRPEDQLRHAGSVGNAAINVQIGIMDAEGRLLPQGEEGEIVYRSPQACGYLYDERATREAFRHGWFHSGDVGYLDADGMLWFKDRYKDVIKSGGENIASIEVEKALYAAEPGIAEAVVIGLPHPRWTEAVTAVIVPKPGVTIDEAALLEKLRGIISPYKCPKALIITESMPKTYTGKIQKMTLRKYYADYFKSGGVSGNEK